MKNRGTISYSLECPQIACHTDRFFSLHSILGLQWHVVLKVQNRQESARIRKVKTYCCRQYATGELNLMKNKT